MHLYDINYIIMTNYFERMEIFNGQVSYVYCQNLLAANSITTTSYSDYETLFTSRVAISSLFGYIDVGDRISILVKFFDGNVQR